jgi:nitrite reductase/ring-hydroxylating ferredoxin subunit
VTVCSPRVLRTDDVPRGAVVAIDVDDHEYVVWRAASGRLCGLARRCPHLDWDLADASVVGDELVCPGHGWSFDSDGHAFKRNLLGRADAKDDVDTLLLDEADGEIRVAR